MPPPLNSPQKPFIISITAATAPELKNLVAAIQKLRHKNNGAFASRIAIELNTSCPNIPGSPPKGYVLDSEPMIAVLDALALTVTEDETLAVGLKLPPYIYAEQFTRVVTLIKQRYESTFAFFTCTNTLGSSLMFSPSEDGDSFALPTPLGGLAGESIHALSLGNVYSFRKALDEAGLQKIRIIGVGGVLDKQGAERMRKAGASIVGCATLLGIKGVDGFKLVAGAN
jgi:dihydroorotate dehydrogenase (fumarate)